MTSFTNDTKNTTIYKNESLHQTPSVYGKAKYGKSKYGKTTKAEIETDYTSDAKNTTSFTNDTKN